MSKKPMPKENQDYIYMPPTITSDLSEPEKRLMAMINGEKPKNESEARMQKEIKEIEKKGYIIDIPAQ